MFVALSKFIIANDKTDAVKTAFQNRPHLVEQATGFLRMDVLSPVDNPNEIWLITYWQDENSYQLWHRSHAYKESHQSIPQGLKLVPKTNEIRFFEYISS
jgi:heme-degrading monooxygenase HmoA